jgi:hypothetical protein
MEGIGQSERKSIEREESAMRRECQQHNPILQRRSIWTAFSSALLGLHPQNAFAEKNIKKKRDARNYSRTPWRRFSASFHPMHRTHDLMVEQATKTLGKQHKRVAK